VFSLVLVSKPYCKSLSLNFLGLNIWVSTG
jgi:hypothetical protein